MQIGIIGGGRWARTIAQVLCTLPKRPDRVVMYTAHDRSALAAWASSGGLAGRIQVGTPKADFENRQGRPNAMIVVNRAVDHFAAARPALFAGVPVLIEKPMAFPSDRIEKLCETGEQSGAMLASSHVFLFARYFERFAAHVATLGAARRFKFIWTDPAAELRYGEAKSYDAGVTIFDDVLPHVMPMLLALGMGDVDRCSMTVSRGGAKISIEASSAGCAVTLILAREAAARKRFIEVETDRGIAALNFAEEPGIIHAPNFRGASDPLWDQAPRPLATMLLAFLTAVECGSPDHRLSPALALRSGKLADAVRRQYVTQQQRWLEQRRGQPLDQMLIYALNEFKGSRTPDMGRITEIWAAMDTIPRLRSFLLRSPLTVAAGSPPPSD
jgi:predicted dehydrogenase